MTSRPSGEGLAATTLGGTKADSYLPLVTGRAVAQRRHRGDRHRRDPGPGRGAGVGHGGAGVGHPQGHGHRSEPRGGRLLADAVITATPRRPTGSRRPAGRRRPRVDPLVQVVPIETALPGVKVAPDPMRNVLIGAVVGLLVGYGLVFLRRQLDTRLRTVADVETETGASVLGVVPLTPELRGHASRSLDQLGLAAEAFRQIRTNLRFVSVDHAPRSIVVTSANAGEGEVDDVGHARPGARRVRPADRHHRCRPAPADARHHLRPARLGRACRSCSPRPGAPLAALQDTEQPNVCGSSPAGRTPPNPSELLGSQRMHALIDHLAKDHLVILDAPPLLPVTDAGLLSGISDGTLLVFAVGRTTRTRSGCAPRS